MPDTPDANIAPHAPPSLKRRRDSYELLRSEPDYDESSVSHSTATKSKKPRRLMAGASSLLERTTSSVARATSTVSQALRRQDRKVNGHIDISAQKSSLYGIPDKVPRDADPSSFPAKEPPSTPSISDAGTTPRSMARRSSGSILPPLSFGSTEPDAGYQPSPEAPPVIPSGRLWRRASSSHLQPVMVTGDVGDFCTPFSPPFDLGYANPLRDAAYRHSPKRPAPSSGDSQSAGIPLPALHMRSQSESKNRQLPSIRANLMGVDKLIQSSDPPTPSYASSPSARPGPDSSQASLPPIPVVTATPGTKPELLFRPHPAPRADCPEHHEEQSDFALGDSDLDDGDFEDAVRRADTLRIIARYDAQPHDPNLPQPHETGRLAFEAARSPQKVDTPACPSSTGHGGDAVHAPLSATHARYSSLSSVTHASMPTRRDRSRSHSRNRSRTPLSDAAEPHAYSPYRTHRPAHSYSSLGSLRAAHHDATEARHIPVAAVLALFADVEAHVRGRLNRTEVQRHNLNSVCELGARCLRVSPAVDELVGRVMDLADELGVGGGEEEWRRVAERFDAGLLAVSRGA